MTLSVVDHAPNVSRVKVPGMVPCPNDVFLIILLEMEAVPSERTTRVKKVMICIDQNSWSLDVNLQPFLWGI